MAHFVKEKFWAIELGIVKVTDIRFGFGKN